MIAVAELTRDWRKLIFYSFGFDLENCSIEKECRFFEKKRRKKILLLWSRDFLVPEAQIHKSLFGSFSS
jgi:hypothetical protein